MRLVLGSSCPAIARAGMCAHGWIDQRAVSAVSEEMKLRPPPSGSSWPQAGPHESTAWPKHDPNWHQNGPRMNPKLYPKSPKMAQHAFENPSTSVELCQDPVGG